MCSTQDTPTLKSSLLPVETRITTDQKRMAGEDLREWSTHLFSCDDPGQCALMLFCPCCYAMWVTKNYGKNPAILLCDLWSLGAFGCIGLPLCVAPASLAVMIDMRHKYGIKGSLHNDMAKNLFCLMCTWCQMDREVRLQKKNQPAVVNVQPAAVTYQPNPRPQTGVVMATY